MPEAPFLVGNKAMTRRRSSSPNNVSFLYAVSQDAQKFIISFYRNALPSEAV